MTGCRRLIIATLGVLILTTNAAAQVSTDTMPAAVVQRFVDAANARDAEAMAALVAPGAIFASFPDGRVIAQGRDAIHTMYTSMLPGLPAGFHITVEPRIVEGNLVVDVEHFAGMADGRNRATWMYQVHGGLIHRAWVLDGRARAAP
jgi:uncharacterized protein (TIGR02246 family)